VFTDGHVADEEQVLASVRQHAGPRLRTFCVAVGPAPNVHLAKYRARLRPRQACLDPPPAQADRACWGGRVRAA
jgi:hypothetical protein